jgi:hypothetical protein
MNKYIITTKGLVSQPIKGANDYINGYTTIQFEGSPDELTDFIKSISKDQSSTKVVGITNLADILIEIKTSEINDHDDGFFEVSDCYAHTSWKMPKTEVLQWIPDTESARIVTVLRHYTTARLYVNKNEFYQWIESGSKQLISPKP